jgi:ribose 1,5-bisphosphate isomerase
MSYSQILKDIKNLKIQGANKVAINSIKAINDLILNSKSKTISQFKKELIVGKNLLLKSRPTEPFMRNSLNYIFDAKIDKNLQRYKKNLLEKIKLALVLIKTTNITIGEIGAKKIENGMKIYTHCHSSTVTSILIQAKKEGKKFVVANTETRPLFQGRITAKELARYGIEVHHYIDSAAKIAMKNADLVLLGADAITTEGDVYNKIGSGMFAQFAFNYDIPVYSCANTWKFDIKTIFGYNEEIENRNKKEIWNTTSKNIKIFNPAFEKIKASLLSGIITELGIYCPETFCMELEKKNKWMFKKN